MSRDVPDSSEECAITFFLEDFYCFVWEGSAGALEAVEASVQVDEGEAEAE